MACRMHPIFHSLYPSSTGRAPRVSLRILRALSLSRVSDVYDGGAGRRPPAGRTTEMSTTST